MATVSPNAEKSYAPKISSWADVQASDLDHRSGHFQCSDNRSAQRTLINHAVMGPLRGTRYWPQ